MRIGIVSGEYPPAVGGVGDQAARLAVELSRLGHQVQVLTSSRSDVPAGRDAAHPLPPPSGRGTDFLPHRRSGGEAGDPQVLRRISRWDWRLLGALPGFAREGRWDVLHLQYQPGAYGLHGAILVAPGWLRRASRAPAVVTTFHDLRVPYLFPKAGPLRRLAVRHLARSCQGIGAASEADVARLRAWTAGLRRAPAVRRIPLGNALDVPPPADFRRESWRARLRIPPDAPVAAHFGFVNRSKGVGVLVEALARLVREGRDLHLLMVGDPRGASDPTNEAVLEGVRRQVEGTGLVARVHWTGYCPPGEAAGWLRCADVAVLPFLDGASPRRTSIQAAWAHGVPVLTTTLSPGERWPASPDPAETVPPGEAAPLSVALARLLDSPARREALARAGGAAAAGFAWPVVVNETLELYGAAVREAG